MAQASAAGGIKLIEITANSDRPWELIELLRAELPDCSIGTGTVLTISDALNAIACGAEYIFTPHLDLRLIDAAIIEFLLYLLLYNTIYDRNSIQYLFCFYF